MLDSECPVLVGGIRKRNICSEEEACAREESKECGIGKWCLGFGGGEGEKWVWWNEKGQKAPFSLCL